MPGSTPNRSYPYPLYGETQDFPTDMQALALAVDTDVANNLADPIALALDQPSVRVHRSISQAVVQNVNVTLTYNTEVYDNDNMANLGVSNTTVTVNTPGFYLVSGSVTIAPSGAAGGAVALVLVSSGGILTNPVGISRALDNDKDTALSYTTLHYVPTTPETLSQFARHNHGAGLTSTAAHFTVTRIT